MKIRNGVLAVIALLFATQMFAQERTKLDIPLVYSYFRFNPEISQAHSRSFNGGGGGVEFNISPMFSVKAEFMGYGSTHFTTTFTAPVKVNPLATTSTIPTGTYDSEGNMFTYMFGPMVKFPVSDRITPFGEILFGGSNTNFYSNLTRAIVNNHGTLSVAPTQHPFTMGIGGGFDIAFHRHFALRPVEIDYVFTRYTNPITGTHNQNHFRYIGGIVFRAW